MKMRLLFLILTFFQAEALDDKEYELYSSAYFDKETKYDVATELMNTLISNNLLWGLQYNQKNNTIGVVQAVKINVINMHRILLSEKELEKTTLYKDNKKTYYCNIYKNFIKVGSIVENNDNHFILLGDKQKDQLLLNNAVDSLKKLKNLHSCE